MSEQKSWELICNRFIGIKSLQIICSSLLFIIDNDAKYKHCIYGGGTCQLYKNESCGYRFYNYNEFLFLQIIVSLNKCVRGY